MSCKEYPLRPAARCSVAQWVRAGWVYLLRGMSTKPCWILYIIVSLAVCLRCSEDCHFNFCIISVGLLWCRQSLCTYLAARLCTILSLFIFCFVVGSQTVEAYSIVGLIGLIAVCFDWSWAVAGVASKKGEGAICFLCDCIYMVVPGQFAINVYPHKCFAVMCRRSP